MIKNKIKFFAAIILCAVHTFCSVSASDMIQVSTDVYTNELSLTAFMPSHTNAPVSVGIVDKQNGDFVYYNQLETNSDGRLTLSGPLLSSSGTYTVRMLAQTMAGSPAQKEFEFTSYSDGKAVWDNFKTAPRDNYLSLAAIIGINGQDELSVADDALLYKEIEAYGDIGEFSKLNAESLSARITQSAQKVLKIRELLADIADMENTTQLKGLLTAGSNAALLEVGDYMARYLALSVTDSVDIAIAGKTFADPTALKQTFATALTTAELTNVPQQPIQQLPSTTSKGSGFGSAPSSQTSVPGDLPSQLNALFNDIAQTPWAKDAIEYLASAGIVNGKADGIFAPNDNILREEFAKLSVSLSGASARSNAPAFADMQADAWYVPYINAAFESGLVNGMSETRFGVGQYITRQDIAVILWRIIKDKNIDIVTDSAQFTDRDMISPYAEEAVKALSSLGVIGGREDGSFAPLSYATRAETACMIYRVLMLEEVA